MRLTRPPRFAVPARQFGSAPCHPPFLWKAAALDRRRKNTHAKCPHCGQENPVDVALCSECGLELGDSPLHRAASQTWERSRRFFRWRPASICLIVLAILYWIVALLSLWTGSVLSHRGQQQMAHLMYWGRFGMRCCASLLCRQANYEPSDPTAEPDGYDCCVGSPLHRNSHLVCWNSH